jgi:ankyrin repeat protein
MKWVLEEGGARITEMDNYGSTALLLAANNINGNFPACQWLLEHGGADIAEAKDAGKTVWTMLVYSAFSVHLADEAVV